MALLSLEALRARHGDCLLLHYGSTEAPRMMLIDGGPSGVYSDALKPRLEELRHRFGGEDGALPLSLVMVSHIDDDHIQGLLDLTGELIESDERGVAPFVSARTLWHNSFESITAEPGDVLSSLDEAEVQRLSTSAEVPLQLREAAAVVASVPQGQRLRDNAGVLGWPLNRPFAELVVAPKKGGRRIDLGADASLLVLAPNEERIEALREEWKRKLSSRPESEAAVAAYVDDSVYNLSSIVGLVEAGDQKVLLTGDARGDDILAGLDAAGVTRNGELRVDVLKLPHHGSDRNVERDFFARIPATHYVISGDGRHGNPEVATLEMLCDARPDDAFTIHFTYRDGRDGLGAKLEAFLSRQRGAGRRFEVEFRDEQALSLRINLLDPLPV